MKSAIPTDEANTQYPAEIAMKIMKTAMALRCAALRRFVDRHAFASESGEQIHRVHAMHDMAARARSAAFAPGSKGARRRRAGATAKVARIVAVAGLLFGNAALVTPVFSQTPSCTASPTGLSVALQATAARGKPFTVASGYHLSVKVNGGEAAEVLVDTGSNALAIPSWRINGFPADPAHDTTGLVISGKLPYQYSSSGNSYFGYLIQVPVQVSGAGNASVSAENVQVLAITEVCGSSASCSPAVPGNSSNMGMMGVGFQPTPTLLVNTAGGTTPATRTNVFQQIPGVETQGWIFEPDGHIVVGLNAESTKAFTSWAPMVPDHKGGISPEGCLRVQEPGKPESRTLCGTMLLDTGMPTMNLWVYRGDPGGAPFCPLQSGTDTKGKKKAGFNGKPFPADTLITLTSPGQAPTVDYSFNTSTPKQPGTPEATYCTNVKGSSPTENAFFNTGRMPLQRYSFARNQTCGTFAYRAGK
ncbi:hypothetical protein [Burkholderia plantarii]|uniref:hypothetical protein n=1 Tax=Burkholderia plantarii TaxID=41899 RepID=UPI001FCD38AA|nr:hypothetical protein [Burkholderia plantarii]